VGRPSTNRIHLIAIAGGSGSGKSWLANRLIASLGRQATAIPIDDFYRDRSHLPLARRARINYDHPRTIDWELLEATLRQAKTGNSFTVPNYSYVEHTPAGRPRKCRAQRFLILEGLWALRSRRLAPLIDFAVYVDASAKWRLARRLERDVAERGRSRASVTRQFREQVEPMHRRFIAPQSRRADLILQSPIDDDAFNLLLQRIDDLG
jgi:uridine kinase